MTTIVRFVVAMALLAAGAARAEDACRADTEKLCAGVLQGDGRILTCLHANEAQLSPACKQKVAFVGKKVRELGAACGDDVYQLCPDVKMGGGRVLRCLTANAAKLSPGCGKAVQQHEEKTAAFKKACGDDVDKHCKGIARGQGRVLSCLEAKQKELTPDCQSLMQPLLAMPAAPATPGAAQAAAPSATPGAAPAAPAAAGTGTGTAPAATPAAAPAAPQATTPAPPAEKPPEKK